MGSTSVEADASVVVCTYANDRWPLLQRAVGSVLRQRRVNEIILVVDHESELLERARRRWGDRVRVVGNELKQGLSGARNSGVALARAEVVAFIDDDAQAEDGWLERLLRSFEDERVVGCGGAVVADTESRTPVWWPHEFDWVVGCSYVGMPSRRAVVRNLLGANMSFRTRSVRAAGGFADGVGRRGADAAGCEETDLCIRMVAMNPESQIVYEPAAVVRHTVGADRLSWRYFMTRCYAEGLSKAGVARRVGAGRALSSERAHAVHALPRGILHALREGIPGARRAGAIAAGLALTTAGYLRGRMTRPPWSETRR